MKYVVRLNIRSVARADAIIYNGAPFEILEGDRVVYSRYECEFSSPCVPRVGESLNLRNTYGEDCKFRVSEVVHVQLDRIGYSGSENRVTMPVVVLELWGNRDVVRREELSAWSEKTLGEIGKYHHQFLLFETTYKSLTPKMDGLTDSADPRDRIFLDEM